MDEHKQHRLDKELRDILNRNSIFDVLAAAARIAPPPVAYRLQAIYDELVPKIPPS